MSAAPRKGDLAAVRDFWAEYPSRFASAWHQLHPGKRQPAAQEIFSHLASSASSAAPVAAPTRSAPTNRAAAPSAPRPRLGGHAVSGVTSGRTAIPPVRPEEFFDRAQEARSAVSPLGGKIW
jgi:hypothetical protein